MVCAYEKEIDVADMSDRDKLREMGQENADLIMCLCDTMDAMEEKLKTAEGLAAKRGLIVMERANTAIGNAIATARRDIKKI